MGLDRNKDDFDQLLHKVGGFGRYQWMTSALIAFWSYLSVEVLYVTFLCYTPDHWCEVPELQNHTAAQQKLLSIPWEKAAQRYSQCQTYDRNYSSLLEEVKYMTSYNMSASSNFSYHDNVTSCQSWYYDKTLYQETVVTKWNLVCERAWLVDFIPTVNILGVLVGSLMGGICSDRYGRKMATLILMVINIIAMIMSLCAASLEVFIVARFPLGVGGLGSYITAYVLLLESTTAEHRTLIGMVFMLAFSLGCMSMAGFAYVERNWRLLQLYCFIPSTITMILIFFCLHESPRWLVQQGKIKKAMKVLRAIGKMNRKPMPNDICLKKKTLSEMQENKKTFLDLFRTPIMRRLTIVNCIVWCTISLIYWALSLNAKALSGNIFINFLLLSSVEIPANIMAFFFLRMRLLGRRLTTAITLIMAGLTCFICVPLILKFGTSYITTGLATLGKGAATAAFSSVYLYSSELFPTEVRNVGLGFCSVAARAGALLAPFVGGYFATLWAPLPSVIFGVTGTVSGTLIFLLKETINTNLPDTIEQVENTSLSCHDSSEASSEVTKTVLPSTLL